MDKTTDIKRIEDIKFETKEVHEYENGYLILFNTSFGKNPILADDNIYFISLNGSIKWRIESYYTYNNSGISLRYFNLRFDEMMPNRFLAMTFTGKRIIVSLDTGKIVDELSPQK